MTLDETIAHAKEVAKENYLQGMLCHANPNDSELNRYIECGREHEQLAIWLEELKELRSMVRCSAFKDGYNKAIDDFRVRINKELHCDFSDDLEIQKYVDKIAEQLKAGKQNDNAGSIKTS